ncbi:hypothetical protein GCM10011409_03900 [Lentibacillus populi]|uniref:Uncharacterized protein n=1 Tax=Lentibacillus populi TaxID=1827502 RepID=A0A9W5X3T4_9BACI|nr:hypothetical protein GCM10011409_03900 [Lentibacillus populi]
MHTSRWALEQDVAYPVIKLSTAAKFYNFLDDKKGRTAKIAAWPA